MQTEDYTSQIFDLKNSLEYYIKENNKNVSTILQIQKDNNDLKKKGFVNIKILNIQLFLSHKFQDVMFVELVISKVISFYH